MSRPRRYVRAGPWMTALRILARHGWSDGQIALCLSQLDGPALLRISRMARPTPEDVDALRREGGGRPWTERQVRYHRRQDGLRSCYRRRLPGLLAAARARRQVYAGWGHLLDWAPALGRRDCAVLSLLRDRGPQTAGDIARLTGAVHSGGMRYLARLRLVGLVIRRDGLYALDPRALPDAAPKPLTSVERRALA